eukprot:67947-Pleurochrysis_carterae.AAC.1
MSGACLRLAQILSSAHATAKSVCESCAFQTTDTNFKRVLTLRQEGSRPHHVVPASTPQGEMASKFFVLLSGAVGVFTDTERVAQVRSAAEAHAEPPLLGESALLRNVPRVASVVCETKCQLLEVKGHGLADVAHVAASLRRVATQTLSMRQKHNEIVVEIRREEALQQEEAKRQAHEDMAVLRSLEEETAPPHASLDAERQGSGVAVMADV